MEIRPPSVGIPDIGRKVFDEALGRLRRGRVERRDRAVQSGADRSSDLLAHILRSALLLLCMITSFIIPDESFKDDLGRSPLDSTNAVDAAPILLRLSTCPGPGTLSSRHDRFRAYLVDFWPALWLMVLRDIQGGSRNHSTSKSTSRRIFSGRYFRVG